MVNTFPQEENHQGSFDPSFLAAGKYRSRSKLLNHFVKTDDAVKSNEISVAPLRITRQSAFPHHYRDTNHAVPLALISSGLETEASVVGRKGVFYPKNGRG